MSVSASSSMPAKNSKANEMEQRMKEYQEFLETVLRPDLERAQKDEQETATEIRDYKDLRDRLKNLMKVEAETGDTTTATTSMMSVDLGHEKVHCNAEISTTRRGDNKDNNDSTGKSAVPHVYVHVGMGFHVEFTLDEALAFVGRRLDFLEGQVLKLKRTKLDQVQQHVNTSESILQELAGKLS